MKICGYYFEMGKEKKKIKAAKCKGFNKVFKMVYFSTHIYFKTFEIKNHDPQCWDTLCTFTSTKIKFCEQL